MHHVDGDVTPDERHHRQRAQQDDHREERLCVVHRRVVHHAVVDQHVSEFYTQVLLQTRPPQVGADSGDMNDPLTNA